MSQSRILQSQAVLPKQSHGRSEFDARLDEQTACLDPFSDEAITAFDYALTKVLTLDLKVEAERSRELVGELSLSLQQDHERALPFVRQRLQETGIGPRWLTVLRHQRPTEIASWLAPHCEGKVLDLLCGNGELGECLARRGLDVTFCERPESYLCDHNHTGTFVPLSLLRCTKSVTFTTVVLCTVLHHEVEHRELLRLAARLCTHKIIVIENTINPTFDQAAHLLMDLFFARSLSSFDLPSAGNHLSLSSWLSMLSGYGHICCSDLKESVPGIPLPHAMIVLDSIGQSR